MIHTFKLIWKLDTEHLEYFVNTHRVNKNMIGQYLSKRFQGMMAVVRGNNYSQTTLDLFVDVTKVLNKGDIIENDYFEIEERIKELLEFAFNDSKLYYEQNLIRIDYRIDILVPDENTRRLYLFLFKKTLRKAGPLKRSTGKLNSSLEYYEYKTTVYHEANSREVIVYDKNEECKASGRIPSTWENQCIRFEVRLKNTHLGYAKRKKGNPKILKTYFTSEMFLHYVTSNLENIYLEGDYYTFGEAEGIIHRSSLSKNKKIALKKFIKLVAFGDLSTPKSNMCPATYRSRINDFNALRLNPITIPQKMKIEGYLPNLLTRRVLKIEELKEGTIKSSEF